MGKETSGTQIEAPGMPAPVVGILSDRVNAAVLAVSEAEKALREARARERAARKALAEARG